MREKENWAENTRNSQKGLKDDKGNVKSTTKLHGNYLQDPAAEFNEKLSSIPTSRPRGLWYDRHHQRWAAYFQFEPSRRKTKYFPVKTYGFSQAYQLAITARSVYDEEMTKVTREGRNVDMIAIMKKVDEIDKCAGDIEKNTRQMHTPKQPENNSSLQNIKSQATSPTTSSIASSPTSTAPLILPPAKQKSESLNILFDLKCQCLPMIAQNLKLSTEVINDLTLFLDWHIQLVQFTQKDEIINLYFQAFYVLIKTNILPSALPEESQLKWIAQVRATDRTEC